MPEVASTFNVFRQNQWRSAQVVLPDFDVGPLDLQPDEAVILGGPACSGNKRRLLQRTLNVEFSLDSRLVRARWMPNHNLLAVPGVVLVTAWQVMLLLSSGNPMLHAQLMKEKPVLDRGRSSLFEVVYCSNRDGRGHACSLQGDCLRKTDGNSRRSGLQDGVGRRF